MADKHDVEVAVQDLDRHLVQREWHYNVPPANVLRVVLMERVRFGLYEVWVEKSIDRGPYARVEGSARSCLSLWEATKAAKWVWQQLCEGASPDSLPPMPEED